MSRSSQLYQNTLSQWPKKSLNNTRRIDKNIELILRNALEGINLWGSIFVSDCHEVTNFFAQCTNKKQFLLTKLPLPLPPCSLLHLGCIPLGWSGSGTVIRDHSDHGALHELPKVWPEWIHQFLWCTTISVILDHWSWSRIP